MFQISLYHFNNGCIFLTTIYSKNLGLHGKHIFSLLQFSSVAQTSLTLCDPLDCSTQASLSITNSCSLLKLMFIELVMPSNHLILCYPLLFLPSIFPSIRVFPKESVLPIRWPNIGVSASASVLRMNIQDLFPLGYTGWISLLAKVLSRVFF